MDTEAANFSVARRLESLRQTAERDAAGVQRETWSWIQELGAARDGETLGRLFALGTPPLEIEGPTEGILVTTLTNTLLDEVVKLITGAWMPWTGKTFHSQAGTGVNQMTKGSELPAKLLWPLYGMRETADGVLAFDFKTGIVRSAIAPEIQVRKIEYSTVSENPALVIRQILDELIELVPSTYLGRILFDLPLKGFVNIGYFALRQPAG